MSCQNCDPEVEAASPRRRQGEASPPRKGDPADLQLFENENQVAPKASFAGHMSIESTPKPVCPAGHVLPEPTSFGSLLVKPASTGR